MRKKMKKNRIAIFAIMSMLLLAMTAGCKGKKNSDADKDDNIEDVEGPTAEVVVELDAADLLDYLSGYKMDSTFRHVLANARLQQQETSDDFIDCFYNLWVEQASGRQLCEIFATMRLRDKVTCLSEDDEVLKVLKTEVADAIDNTENVIRTRLEKAGMDCDIERLRQTTRLKVMVSNFSNHDQVLRLIASRGNLEFWETYSSEEIVPSLQQLFIQDMQESEEIDPSLQQIISQQEDTLQPKIVFLHTGMGIVGLSSVSDTAKVNRILQSDAGQRLMRENNLKLLWSAKPDYYHSDGIDKFGLYAIRVTDPMGRAALDGDVIVSAKDEFDQMGKPVITMQMNVSGSREWARLTRENINKCIAIVLDNEVYSAPYVNSEIDGGYSQISGNFTIEETREMADVLNSGRLPVGVRILSDIFTE